MSWSQVNSPPDSLLDLTQLSQVQDENDVQFTAFNCHQGHHHHGYQGGSPGYSCTPSQGGSLASDLFHSDLEFRYYDILE